MCWRTDLNGHRKNLLVQVSLEQSFGVRAVVLAPASIRPYEVRWEQDDVVSQPSQRPCPEVSRAAGFEKHGGSALFRKKRHQLGSTHTELLGHLPRFARDGNLEDVLCKTHSDRRIFSFGLLLFRCVLSTDFGTSMPSMSAEESIPSLDGGSTSVARQRQSAEPPPRRTRVRKTSTPMAVCPSIRDLLFADHKGQHGDKDMPSNWRSRPRPVEKSTEQGRPHNRRPRETVEDETVAAGSVASR